MNGIIGEFRIGEDLSLALDATSGDTATVSGLTAAMKPARISANRIILDESVSAIAMTVAPQSPASGGWIVSLTSAQTAALAAGIYGIDARLVVGGGIEITDQTAFVRLSKAALA